MDQSAHHARYLLQSAGVGFREVFRSREGREHHLFEVVLDSGERRLLKFARDPWLQDPRWPDRTPIQALRAEARAISMVRDVAVPDPYDILDGNPPGALLGVVQGLSPDVVLEKGHMDETRLAAICLAMGRILAQIHLVRRPPDDVDIPLLAGADPENARLLHMDFHLGNVIGVARMGDSWSPRGVVDWTCCKWGPREADFAEMGVSVFATNPRMLEHFLLGYRQVSGLALDPGRVRHVIAVELMRRLRDDPPSDPRLAQQLATRASEWHRPE